MDIIELSNGTSIQCKALSAAEYKRLLKGANAERIERYALHYEIDVHKVDEKTILVRENDYYTLYFSLNDLDNVLMDAASGNTGKEIMLNKNKYGSDFPANTGALIRQLCDALQMEYVQVSPEFLAALDDKMDALKNPVEFKRKYFLNLIAVVGEAFNAKHQAAWEMVQAEDGVTWNPFIKIRGEHIQCFVYLYEDVFIASDNTRNLLSEIFKTMDDIQKYNIKK